MSNRSGHVSTTVANVRNIKRKICGFCLWVYICESFFYNQFQARLDPTRKIASVVDSYWGHNDVVLCGDWLNPYARAKVTLRYYPDRWESVGQPQVGLVMRPSDFGARVVVPQKRAEVFVVSGEEEGGNNIIRHAQIVQYREEDGTFDVRYALSERNFSGPRCRGGDIETGVPARRIGVKRRDKFPWLYAHWRLNAGFGNRIRKKNEVTKVGKGDSDPCDTTVPYRKAWKCVTMTLERGLFSYYFDGEEKPWGTFPVAGDIEVQNQTSHTWQQPPTDMRVAFALCLIANCNDVELVVSD